MSRGELQLVEWLRHHLRTDAARVPIGIGDDMAAVKLDGSLVAITSDMLLDGVHFDTRQHGYDLIGRKAIACSLSDCAAMGCSPRAATVSIALNEAMTMENVQRLYEGMDAIAGQFDCPIAGGDTTSWKGGLAIDVAMIAEPMASRGPIRRSTARPGNTIYVSGPLGGSVLGRHLTFVPRLDLVRRLVQRPELRAMMDLSDGLSLDLYRMCAASDCCAEVEVGRLEPLISEDARCLSQQDGRPALEHALSDGEDFELLVAGESGLEDIAELRAVGRIVDCAEGGPGTMHLIHADGRRERLEPKGYEHFT